MTDKNSPPDQPFEYEGFSSPRTTQVPDDVFDVLMPQLKDAELRVLLYIIRRTYGFKKDTDNISLRQMVEGITTRDGRVLDRGTGLPKSAVARALVGLREKKIIAGRRNRSAERGNEATTYRLRFKDESDQIEDLPHDPRANNNEISLAPLSPQRDKGLSPQQDKPLSLYEDTQQTGLQQTESNLSNIRRKINLGKSFGDSGDNSASQAVAPSRTRSATAPNTPQDPLPTVVGGEDNDVTARSTDVESVGQVLKRGRGRPPKQPYTEERQQIHAYIKDFAPQLGDQAPLASSVTRAYNLYLRSGWPIAHFIDALYQARAKTRERSGGIRTALPKDDPWGTKPKMAYFFSVLEDEVGLRDEEPATATR